MIEKHYIRRLVKPYTDPSVNYQSIAYRNRPSRSKRYQIRLDLRYIIRGPHRSLLT